MSGPFLRVRYLNSPPREGYWVSELTRELRDPQGRRIDYKTTIGTIAATGDMNAAVRDAFKSEIEAGYSELPAGEYWPRIYRPGAPPLDGRTIQARDNAVHAARAVFRRLQEVFLYLEPGGSNLQAYGHETRNLLILACTAVESAWRGALRENGYERRNPTTGAVVEERFWNAQADYQQCLAAMRLGDWAVRIAGRDQLGDLRPFAGWNGHTPLPWYAAYNAAKHDMENALSRATLQACVDACAALAIMIWAQFGTWTVDQAMTPIYRLQLSAPGELAATDPFLIQREPEWTIGECYAPPRLLERGDDEWRAVGRWRPAPP